VKRDRESWTTQADDEGVQAAVIRQLLELHPSTLTATELVREMTGERATFAERDAVERALRELEAVGLLHRGELVTPTRAALRLSELLDR
jgi:Fe2+ or Zn2+ uptake regulation protein